MYCNLWQEKFYSLINIHHPYMVTKLIKRIKNSETVLSGQNKVLKTNSSLMKVESIAECSLGVINGKHA